MLMKLNINDRAALAIKNNTKRVEIRANKESGNHDYSKLKPNDIIEFTSNNLGVFYVKVREVNHYDSLEELFALEGTRYTTSSTNDKEEAIKNVNKLDGYESAIKKNGVYAIHIEYLNSENMVWKELYEIVKNVRTPNDILEFMNENIQYGWLDIYNNEHIGNMEDFRKLYRTSSIEEIFQHKIGTCIEQVYLMKFMLDKLDIPNKMFCTRIYEPNDFNELEQEEHMHCFVLYYQNNKVYQIEHPNLKKVGIYEFESEEAAINNINKYYINISGGIPRPVTEFYEVESNISFKEFNNYINSLDRKMK